MATRCPTARDAEDQPEEIEDDVILAPEPISPPKPRSLVVEAVALARSWAKETGNSLDVAADYLQVAAVELRGQPVKVQPCK